MQSDDFADLLRGAAAIAAYTGENYRQTVYKLSTGQLPGSRSARLGSLAARRSVRVFSVSPPPSMGAAHDKEELVR